MAIEKSGIYVTYNIVFCPRIYLYPNIALKTDIEKKNHLLRFQAD